MQEIIPQDIPSKQCNRCKKFFPPTKQYFYSHKNRADGLSTLCKTCVDISNKEHRLNPPPSYPEGYKPCPRCKEIKQTTTENFERNAQTSTGWACYCKECKRKDYRAKHPLTEPPIPEGYKRCCKALCRTIYPATLEYFHRNKASIDGLSPECKECHNKRSKEWSRRPEVRETRLDRQKEWNDTHKDSHREYYQVYNQINKENEYYKLGVRIRAQKRRAREKKVLGTYTPEQIQEQLKRQKRRCYYCATQFEKKNGQYIYHVDHTFPLSRVIGTAIPANSIDYLVLACPFCNISKGDRFPWEWPQGGRLL